MVGGVAVGVAALGFLGAGEILFYGVDCADGVAYEGVWCDGVMGTTEGGGISDLVLR